MLNISPRGELVVEKETIDSLARELLSIITDHYDSVENQEQQEESSQ